MTQKHRATSIGFAAVLLWSLLALFTVGSAPVPPLLLNTLCFSVGGAIGLLWTWRSGRFSVLKTVPLKVYGFGTLGLFGYHALYFSALRLAPPAEAGLIAYLWPLLIVLLSGLLPGEKIRTGHFAGAFLGFVGAALLISGAGAGFDVAALPGYLLALACALTWAGYSVISRWLGAVPTESVAIFCIAAALLSGVMHMALEITIWPQNAIGWASVAALGLGPVGLAFYVWDIGVKRGDIQLLGTASYAAPVLSTLVLVGAGIAAPSWRLTVATLLVTGGAVIAARASMSSRSDG